MLIILFSYFGDVFVTLVGGRSLVFILERCSPPLKFRKLLENWGMMQQCSEKCERLPLVSITLNECSHAPWYLVGCGSQCGMFQLAVQ